MKRRALIQHLKRHGCYFIREGGNHYVAYVPMDSASDWKLKLRQGMRKAGLPVDMDKIF